MTFKEGLSLFYYMVGAVAFVLAFIRVLYGWFRDFDNANRFTADMAMVHLPYIHHALRKLAERLEVDLESAPPINFSSGKPPYQA